MKKCAGNKSNSATQKPKDVCKICNQKSSCHSKASGVSLNQKKSNISSKASAVSFSSKGEKDSNDQCSCCTKKSDNMSMLDMITEDKVCMCQVFANAFRSDIHMNMGTYIHQNASESNSEENIIDYD